MTKMLQTTEQFKNI